GLLLGHVAGLVVHDHGALGRLVHAIEAPAHPVGREAEPELALHLGGLLPRGLLLVVEARERLPPCPPALLLVLAREAPLVAPGVIERPEEVLERGVVARRAPAQVELHGL